MGTHDNASEDIDQVPSFRPGRVHFREGIDAIEA